MVKMAEKQNGRHKSCVFTFIAISQLIDGIWMSIQIKSVSFGTRGTQNRKLLCIRAKLNCSKFKMAAISRKYTNFYIFTFSFDFCKLK